MTVNSKLSKVLNLRQDYLCNFHLRSSAWFSVAVYGWRSLYRLYWGVTTPCIVTSVSSNCLYRCIGEFQLPVLLHIEEFQLPVSNMRYCTILSNLHFLRFSVFIGIPLDSGRSDINVGLEENFNFFSKVFFYFFLKFVAVLSRSLVTCCGFGALLSYCQSFSAVSSAP